MRKITYIILAVFATIPFAFSTPVTWDSFRDPGRYSLKNNYISGENVSLDIFNSCIDGNKIRQIKPSEVCVKYKRPFYKRGYKSKKICTEWRKVKLSTPISFNKTKCTKYLGKQKKICVTEKDVSIVLPKVISVDIFERIRAYTHKHKKNYRTHKDRNKRYLFSKNYVIPKCDNLDK